MRNKVTKRVLTLPDRFFMTKWFNHDYNKCELTFVIDHDLHTIEMYVVSKNSPHLHQLISFLVHDSDVRKELLWALTSYERKYKTGYTVYTSDSGSKNLSFFYADGIPKTGSKEFFNNFKCRHKILDLHISCCDKLNDTGYLKLFSGDLLDLLNIFFTRVYDPTEEYVGNDPFYWSEFVLTKDYSYKVIDKMFRYLPLNKPSTEVCEIASPCGVYGECNVKEKFKIEKEEVQSE